MFLTLLNENIFNPNFTDGISLVTFGNKRIFPEDSPSFFSFILITLPEPKNNSSSRMGGKPLSRLMCQQDWVGFSIQMTPWTPTNFSSSYRKFILTLLFSRLTYSILPRNQLLCHTIGYFAASKRKARTGLLFILKSHISVLNSTSSHPVINHRLPPTVRHVPTKMSDLK